MGSKSGGGAGQTYDYYGTLAGGLCVGPVDEIISIILNGSEAWPRGIAWVLGNSCSPGILYVFDAQTWTCTTTHVATNVNAPGSGLEGWTEYTFKYHGSTYDDFSLYSDNGTFQGVLRLYWGTSAQTVDYYLESANNDGGIKGNLGSGDQHPDYKGVCYCVLIDFLLGQEIQSGPNVEIVVRRVPNQTLMTGNPALITDGQANLAAVLCEILTDPNFLGLPTTMIDTTSFQATANFMDTNQANYNASVLIDTAESLRSVLDKMMQMIDGFIRFNPSTQLIELGIYEHGVIPSTYATVTTVTADMLTKKPQFKAESWQATFSRATVRYNSRQLAYQETSVYADDARAFFILGTTRDQALERPYIAREGQALIHGRETLRVIGHAQMKGTLEVRREFGREIRAGDFVFVDIDLEPGGASVYQYFRVTQRKIPPTGPIALELFADNTLAAVPFSTPYPTVPPGTATVDPITALRVLQVTNTLSDQINAITVLAQRPDNLIAGCQLYFDTSRVLTATVVSLTADSTGAIGILTFNTAPGFSIGDFMDVGGATNSAFNVSLATVTYATGSVVKYALNATVAANLAASGTIVVADYFTTFSNIGSIPNFAAAATLHTALTNSATTLVVNVDTTQPDADYFTQQYSANDAANDTMLAFIVSLVASGTDAGQVAESGGFGVYEICSISSQTLVTAGQYSLSVLRGRQGTNPAAFTTANTEVWVIPRSALPFFVNGAFDVIRANRTANTVPQYAQFRFCPYTFAAALPLSSAVNHQFRFPLISAGAPVLALSSPSGSTITNNGANLPLRIDVVGQWTDVDDNLIEAKLSIRLATESSDRVIFDKSFPAQGSYSFNRYVQLDGPGSWTIKIWARDATGATTEVDIAVNITGGTARCAMPDLFDCNGNQILNAGGDYQVTTNSALSTTLFGGQNSGTAYKALPAQYFPFGPLNLTCSTPGATIEFFTTGIIQTGATLSNPTTTTWSNFSENPVLVPFHNLVNPGFTAGVGGSAATSLPMVTNYIVIARCTAPGYSTSYAVGWVMPLFI
jgi:hypothetical protein